MFALGVWIFLIPFLGFPRTWDQFFICVSGLIIAGDATMLYIKHRLLVGTNQPQSTSKTYAESQPVTTISSQANSSVSENDPGKNL